jgi:cytochrome c-type biogenesis protein CcmH
MADWQFWVVAASLAGAVTAVLVAALGRSPGAAGSEDRASADLAIYKDQLAEVTRDLERGTIATEEATRLRAEIGKRVIEADRAMRDDPFAGGSLGKWPVTLVIGGLILPGTLAAYWLLGAPGYPDMALAPRLASLDAGIAARPGQAAELERLGTPRDAALDTALAGELVALSDPDALRTRFAQEFEAGNLQAAVRVQERLTGLPGEVATATDHANLALALVVEAGGYVSPEAEAALRESLRRDMGNELARYLVGEMFLQGGRFDQAFRFWRPIAEDGTPGAPWVASVRERIAEVAELAGIRYALPEAAPSPGPDAEDIATAEAMTPEDRQAMIEGMVAQLSDRLATEGGTVEDWNRLIRSLGVLERLPEAQAIYDEAKAKFAGRPAELSFLRLAAVETGLSP